MWEKVFTIFQCLQKWGNGHKSTIGCPIRLGLALIVLPKAACVWSFAHLHLNRVRAQGTRLVPTGSMASQMTGLEVN
ncbi:unnamed protein product [Camellia sinensis]